MKTTPELFVEYVTATEETYRLHKEFMEYVEVYTRETNGFRFWHVQEAAQLLSEAYDTSFRLKNALLSKYYDFYDHDDKHKVMAKMEADLNKYGAQLLTRVCGGDIEPLQWQ